MGVQSVRCPHSAQLQRRMEGAVRAHSHRIAKPGPEAVDKLVLTLISHRGERQQSRRPGRAASVRALGLTRHWELRKDFQAMGGSTHSQWSI